MRDAQSPSDSTEPGETRLPYESGPPRGDAAMTGLLLRHPRRSRRHRPHLRHGDLRRGRVLPHRAGAQPGRQPAAHRSATPRAKQVHKAHQTLSFQLSGAQVGITITTLTMGYLAEPIIARLVRAAAVRAVGVPDGAALPIARGRGADARERDLDAVRRAGAEEPRDLQAAAPPPARSPAPRSGSPRRCAGSSTLLNSVGELAGAQARRRAGRRAGLRAVAAGAGLAGPHQRRARHARPGHGDAAGPVAAVRRAHRPRS